MRLSRPEPVLLFVLFAAMALLVATVWYPIQRFYDARPAADFTYALDDAYIHLAIAKNLAHHGVFGVTPEAFTPSSSSLLWTILLVPLIWIFGPNSWIPFWLALTFAFLALAAMSAILLPVFHTNPLIGAAGLLFFPIAVPLAPLVLSGMETTAQVFFTLAFVWIVLRILPGQKPEVKRSEKVFLIVTGLLFSALRYEHVALLGIVVLLLAVRRWWALAWILLLAAVLPIVVFGVISVVNGWYFLPSSVMVKALAGTTTVGVFNLAVNRLVMFGSQVHLWVLALGVLCFLFLNRKRLKETSYASMLSFLFILALLAHAVGGGYGWFFRYEAYLVALGWVSLIALGAGFLKMANPANIQRFRVVVAAAILFMAMIPLYQRGSLGVTYAHKGMTNIYDQQVHMARFLNQYYAGDVVLINDIGAISLWGNVGIVDLYGLATLETASAKLDGRALKPVIDQLVHEKGVRIAVIYPSWFPGDVTSGWVPAGYWRIDMQITVGGDTVMFYAVKPEEVENLRKNLFEFSPQLPPGEQWFVYP